MDKSYFRSKHTPQIERFTLSSHKNRVVFSMLYIHSLISPTQNGKSRVKFGNVVTKSTEFTIAVVTLELQTAQQVK